MNESTEKDFSSETIKAIEENEKILCTRCRKNHRSSAFILCEKCLNSFNRFKEKL
jgi:late competence protein required for DNA uptake (superfamily II DNA/RNA helicase)